MEELARLILYPYEILGKGILIAGIGIGACYYVKQDKVHTEKYERAISLSDVDRNGILNITEQVDLWKRAGRTTPYIEGSKNNPELDLKKLNTSELERAISSYKIKN